LLIKEPWKLCGGLTSPLGVAENTPFTLVDLHLNTTKTKRQALELAYWVPKRRTC